MRNIIKILFGLFLIHSCSEIESGEIRMNKFIDDYRSSFLNSDLTKFNYDPRCKFENYNDSVAYRVFRRDDSKLLVSLWTEKKYLDTTEKIQKFISNYLDFATENKENIRNAGLIKIKWLGKDSINNFMLIGDSNKVFRLPKSTFDFDPISYFADLDSLIDFYGIIEIKKYTDYIQLVFDTDKSLVYYPRRNLIDTLNKDFIKIDKSWYFTKKKMNLDYY